MRFSAVFYIAVFLIFPNLVWAQSISLTSSDSQVADTDEFFTDVWGDPKDFDSICDTGTDGFFQAPKGVSNGIWTGYNAALTGGYISPAPIPTTGTLLTYREDCYQLALHSPINANKYTQLSWKMRLSNPYRYSVLWSKDANYTIHGFDQPDQFQVPGYTAIPSVANTWLIKNIYLPSAAPGSFPWTGDITGFTIGPSWNTPPGGYQSFDWLRITDPTVSPTVNMSWSTVGGTIGADRVRLFVDDNASGYDGIMVDYNLAVSDSKNISTGFLPPGTYYFYVQLERYGSSIPNVRAQSNYYGPIQINGKPRFNFTAPTRTSGYEYSRDEAGDAWDMNQATDVINLVRSDGSTPPPNERGFYNYSFSGGVFTAKTQAASASVTVDTQVHLNVPYNKPVNTDFYRYFCYRMHVDPVHLSRSGDAHQLNLAGWVARLIYWRGGVQNLAFGSTAAHELVERSQVFPDNANGMTTYCIDLWDSRTNESGPTWRDLDWITHVRFDPLEAALETNFAIDHAGLYSENKTNASNQYNLTWEISDPENDTVSIALYYDNDNSGFNGTHIATLNSQSTTTPTGSYNWNATGVPSGAYYVYAVINDGVNTQRRYSDVVVNVSGTAGLSPAPARAPCDFDGDKRTDFGVIRSRAGFSSDDFSGPQIATCSVAVDNSCKSASKAKGVKKGSKCKLTVSAKDAVTKAALGSISFSVQRSRTAGSGYSNYKSGALDSSGKKSISIKFDGKTSYYRVVTNSPYCASSELTVFGQSDKSKKKKNGNSQNADATWHLLYTSTGAPGTLSFGDTRYDVFMDFDTEGDRLADETISRARRAKTINFISYTTANLGTKDVGWGVLGDIPVNADFDGDRATDYAVFRPTQGMWYFSRSFLGAGSLAWGQAKDIPVAADYDGDGWDDFAVWTPATGVWSILQSSRNSSSAPADTIVRSWGAADDHPMPGDYDGDGTADLVVWRPSNGVWYICHSSRGFDCNQSSAVAFGMNGDLPVRADFDGDGVLDYAIWRASNGGWYWISSSNSLPGSQAWGQTKDMPLCVGPRVVAGMVPNK